jgi:hypothetical protein
VGEVKGLGAFAECGAGWMFYPTFFGEGQGGLIVAKIN